jgi:hypothetical protein
VRFASYRAGRSISIAVGSTQLVIRPARVAPSSGEDPRPRWQLPVLTKVDADLAPSAEQWTARGRVVLPIFIRQGWPQAMSHLPVWQPPVECARLEVVVMQRVKRARLFVWLRQHRHQLLDEGSRPRWPGCTTPGCWGSRRYRRPCWRWRRSCSLAALAG